MNGSLLEDRLTELFEAQAATVRPSLGEWDDVIVDDLAERRNRRRVWAVSAVAAACVVLMVAVGWAATRDRSHAPADAGPSDLSSEVVQFTADSIVIRLNGRDFSPSADVQVDSDPSTTDPTLELTWREHGVEMRMNFYFSRGINTWRLVEVRVYDGRQQPDWLIPAEPLVLSGTSGFPETGDINEHMVSRDGVPAGRLIIRNFTLLPLPGCARCLPLPGGPVPTIDTAFANVVDMAAPETKAP